MRYLTAVYWPPEGEAFHPVGQALADADGVTREYVHRTESGPDDTVVALLSVRGDPAVAAAALEDVEEVVDFAVADRPTCGALVYARYEPTELVERLERARNDIALLIDGPAVVRESGAVEITYLGTEAAFADALDNVSDVPVEVLETGEYEPARRDAFDALTDRQAEVVDAAVRMGYYESPRRATQDEVADAVGCSPTTAGEHLRKAEARVFSQFVDAE